MSKEADAESSAIEETSVVATIEATTEEMTTEEETLLGELEAVGMVGIASADLIGLTGTVDGVNYTLSYTTYGDATSNYAKITGFTAADGATECAVIIPSYIDINETSIPVTEIAANVFKNKTSGEYIQLTEEGFVVASEITKVEYNYTTPDLGKLMVTMNLVSELEEEEEIILKDIADLDINAFVTKIYTGEETFQNIVINDGTYMLREYVDYKVTYRDNIEVGTAKVEIEGIGNYRGSYENTYEIVNEWNVTIKAISDQTYQNKKLEPELTVKDGRKTLRAGIDYKAEYLNNKNTGVATVVVTGFGKYAGAGMKEITFNIMECKISKVSFAIDPVTYNGTAQESVVTTIHNKAYIKEGKDFKTSYSKNVKAGKGTVTITGIGNYTGTVKKTFTINKINLKELSDNDVTINGPAKYNITGAKFGVTVRSGNYQLVEGTDYTLSYSNNKALGSKAKVIIKGMGSCKNQLVKEFEIEPQNIDDASIHIDVAIAQVDKNGKALKPKVTVTQNKKKLREGKNKDYIISYDETATTKKGAYTVTIYGKNKFGGSEKEQFED